MSSESPARILIVDDEAAQMKALCDTLRDHGYETVGFSGANSALAALRQKPFDLLLADLMMPEMSGIELLHSALGTDPNLVGIIMTGQGTIATAVEAMKTGALDYVLKPFTLSAMLPVLSRALTVRALRMENAALTRRLQERTDELEAANKELGAFSYSVSHDLQAPIRAILGFSEMLLNQHAPNMSDEGRRLLNIVKGSAKKAAELIEGLLRLSHLGRQPLKKRPVNTLLLVQEVVEDLHKQQGDRRVEIRVGELPDCIGDPSLLRQVFVNLLSNAVKFTRQKENALIEIGFRREGAEEVYFVGDNGAGFNMKYTEKLFGAFQRMHSGEEFEGTGVGLSIVERIIRRHGGRIWADSTVGKGSIFHFTLPK